MEWRTLGTEALCELLRRLGGGSQAAGAHTHLRADAIGIVLRDALDVDVPAPTRLAVRVADAVSELRAFAADLTLCHG